MKFYKYYETKAEYDDDIKNININDHYTIYIADTNTSLINGLYTSTGVPYCVYDNSSSNTTIQLFNNKNGEQLTNIEVLTDGEDTSIPLTTGTINYTTKTNKPLYVKFTLSASADKQKIFENCNKLLYVQNDLFSPNTGVKNIENAFYNCSKLKEIPSGLFKGCNLITNATNAFNGCASLKIVPYDLFLNNNSLLTVEGCFSRTGIEYIQDGFLSNNASITNAKDIFYSCIKLVYCPKTLFFNSTNLQDVGTAFAVCEKLSKYVPILSNNKYLYEQDIASHDSCFVGCVELENYSSIPSGWK